MELLNKIRNYIIQIEENQFKKYLMGACGAIVLLLLGLMYLHYSRMTYWRKQINTINGYREIVKTIVDKDELVLRQRTEVNTILSENPDFKIDGYFTELLARLGLERNKKETSITYADRGDTEYREVLLNAKFDAMNMRQLTELLNQIEQNNMVYTKELDISKSKKIPNTIDVTLTIATLQKKPETTELE